MEKIYNYNGSDIFYTITGEGQPVVLLHGFAENSTIWKEQVSFLQPHCQLIVPDLPGSGSSPLLQQEHATIEDYANCIHSLLAAENIDNCILLGHSMGGYITLAFAEKFSAKLAAYGLVHSTAFADNEEKKETRRKAIALIQEYGVYPFIKNSTPNLFSAAFKKDHFNVVSDLIEEGKAFSKDALIQYYRAMIARPDRTAVLKNSTVPVLFIIGSEDVAAPLNDLLQQVHLPRISYMQILNNVGHMGMLENPGELNDFLLSFIIDCSIYA
jgi:pimeloyl-ACP methyl ester carboxylesterase